MNRNEFIEKLGRTYDDFTEKNTLPRTEAYCIVLPEKLPYGNSYDDLWEELMKNYDSLKFAPSPAYILKLANSETLRVKEGLRRIKQLESESNK